MRTQYDLEMMAEVGYCSGIENYSMHIDGRDFGQPPFTLARLLPRRLPARHRREPRRCSAATRPVRGRPQSQGHPRRARLPPPVGPDNRPLTFDEVLGRINQCIFMSATPAAYELRVSEQVVEQIVRPTGLVDPEVIVKPTKGQIDDLIESVNERVEAATGSSSPRSPRRWPRTSPSTCSSRACGCATCTPTSTRSSASRSSAPCASASSTCSSASTFARGSRPSRGIARRHSRRRQGGLPVGDVADPDDWPGRPQRRRPGGDVRRPDHRLDEAGDRHHPERRPGRSRTTPSTGSTRRRSARRSATSCRCCGPTTWRRSR